MTKRRGFKIDGRHYRYAYPVSYRPRLRCFTSSFTSNKVTMVAKDFGNEILGAIRRNDLKRLQKILEGRLRLDSLITKVCVTHVGLRLTPENVPCPLIAASQLQDPAILQYMLEKGADPNYVECLPCKGHRPFSYCPLHAASRLGCLETAETLLASGANPGVIDSKGESPLLIAVRAGNCPLAKLLLSSGANPNGKDRHGSLPLHIAASQGHLEMVRVLLAFGADPLRLPDKRGALPVHVAATSGHAHLMRTLLGDEKASSTEFFRVVDSIQQTPLHLAAGNGSVDVVAALLDSGADVKCKDSQGNTALHRVVLKPYQKNVMKEMDQFYATALALIRAGVGIEDVNNEGEVALALAANNRYPKIANLIMSSSSRTKMDVRPETARQIWTEQNILPEDVPSLPSSNETLLSDKRPSSSSKTTDGFPSEHKDKRLKTSGEEPETPKTQELASRTSAYASPKQENSKTSKTQELASRTSADARPKQENSKTSKIQELASRTSADARPKQENSKPHEEREETSKESRPERDVNSTLPHTLPVPAKDSESNINRYPLPTSDLRNFHQHRHTPNIENEISTFTVTANKSAERMCILFDKTSPSPVSRKITVLKKSSSESPVDKQKSLQEDMESSQKTLDMEPSQKTLSPGGKTLETNKEWLERPLSSSEQKDLEKHGDPQLVRSKTPDIIPSGGGGDSTGKSPEKDIFDEDDDSCWIDYKIQRDQSVSLRDIRRLSSPSYRRHAKSPSGFYSEGGGLRGLKMRVAGEVPKAYSCREKAAARRAFMLARPVGIESVGEYDRTRLSMLSLPEVGGEAWEKAFQRRVEWTEPLEPVFMKRKEKSDSATKELPSNAIEKSSSGSKEFSSNAIGRTMTPDGLRPSNYLIAGLCPQPYKSFGKIETKTDAIDEAMLDEESDEEYRSDDDMEQQQAVGWFKEMSIRRWQPVVPQLGEPPQFDEAGDIEEEALLNEENLDDSISSVEAEEVAGYISNGIRTPDEILVVTQRDGERRDSNDVDRTGKQATNGKPSSMGLLNLLHGYHPRGQAPGYTTLIISSLEPQIQRLTPDNIILADSSASDDQEDDSKTGGMDDQTQRVLPEKPLPEEYQRVEKEFPDNQEIEQEVQETLRSGNADFDVAEEISGKPFEKEVTRGEDGREKLFADYMMINQMSEYVKQLTEEIQEGDVTKALPAKSKRPVKVKKPKKGTEMLLQETYGDEELGPSGQQEGEGGTKPSEQKESVEKQLDVKEKGEDIMEIHDKETERKRKKSLKDKPRTGKAETSTDQNLNERNTEELERTANYKSEEKELEQENQSRDGMENEGQLIKKRSRKQKETKKKGETADANRPRDGVVEESGEGLQQQVKDEELDESYLNKSSEFEMYADEPGSRRRKTKEMGEAADINKPREGVVEESGEGIQQQVKEEEFNKSSEFETYADEPGSRRRKTKKKEEASDMNRSRDGVAEESGEGLQQQVRDGELGVVDPSEAPQFQAKADKKKTKKRVKRTKLVEQETELDQSAPPTTTPTLPDAEKGLANVQEGDGVSISPHEMNESTVSESTITRSREGVVEETGEGLQQQVKDGELNKSSEFNTYADEPGRKRKTKKKGETADINRSGEGVVEESGEGLQQQVKDGELNKSSEFDTYADEPGSRRRKTKKKGETADINRSRAGVVEEFSEGLQQQVKDEELDESYLHKSSEFETFADEPGSRRRKTKKEGETADINRSREGVSEESGEGLQQQVKDGELGVVDATEAPQFQAKADKKKTKKRIKGTKLIEQETELDQSAPPTTTPTLPDVEKDLANVQEGDGVSISPHEMNESTVSESTMTRPSKPSSAGKKGKKPKTPDTSLTEGVLPSNANIQADVWQEAMQGEPLASSETFPHATEEEEAGKSKKKTKKSSASSKKNRDEFQADSLPRDGQGVDSEVLAAESEEISHPSEIVRKKKHRSKDRKTSPAADVTLPLKETDVDEFFRADNDVRNNDVRNNDVGNNDVRNSNVRNNDVRNSDVRNNDVRSNNVRVSDGDGRFRQQGTEDKERRRVSVETNIDDDVELENGVPARARVTMETSVDDDLDELLPESETPAESRKSGTGTPGITYQLPDDDQVSVIEPVIIEQVGGKKTPKETDIDEDLDEIPGSDEPSQVNRSLETNVDDFEPVISHDKTRQKRTGVTETVETRASRVTNTDEYLQQVFLEAQKKSKKVGKKSASTEIQAPEGGEDQSEKVRIKKKTKHRDGTGRKSPKVVAVKETSVDEDYEETKEGFPADLSVDAVKENILKESEQRGTKKVEEDSKQMNGELIKNMEEQKRKLNSSGSRRGESMSSGDENVKTILKEAVKVKRNDDYLSFDDDDDLEADVEEKVKSFPLPAGKTGENQKLRKGNSKRKEPVGTRTEEISQTSRREPIEAEEIEGYKGEEDDDLWSFKRREKKRSKHRNQGIVKSDDYIGGTHRNQGIVKSDDYIGERQGELLDEDQLEIKSPEDKMFQETNLDEDSDEDSGEGLEYQDEDFDDEIATQKMETKHVKETEIDEDFDEEFEDKARRQKVEKKPGKETFYKETSIDEELDEDLETERYKDASHKETGIDEDLEEDLDELPKKDGKKKKHSKQAKEAPYKETSVDEDLDEDVDDVFRRKNQAKETTIKETGIDEDLELGEIARRKKKRSKQAKDAFYKETGIDEDLDEDKDDVGRRKNKAKETTIKETSIDEDIDDVIRRNKQRTRVTETVFEENEDNEDDDDEEDDDDDERRNQMRIRSEDDVMRHSSKPEVEETAFDDDDEWTDEETEEDEMSQPHLQIIPEVAVAVNRKRKTDDMVMEPHQELENEEAEDQEEAEEAMYRRQKRPEKKKLHGKTAPSKTAPQGRSGGKLNFSAANQPHYSETNIDSATESDENLWIGKEAEQPVWSRRKAFEEGEQMDMENEDGVRSPGVSTFKGALSDSESRKASIAKGKYKETAHSDDDILKVSQSERFKEADESEEPTEGFSRRQAGRTSFGRMKKGRQPSSKLIIESQQKSVQSAETNQEEGGGNRSQIQAMSSQHQNLEDGTSRQKNTEITETTTTTTTTTVTEENSSHGLPKTPLRHPPLKRDIKPIAALVPLATAFEVEQSPPEPVTSPPSEENVPSNQEESFLNQNNVDVSLLRKPIAEGTVRPKVPRQRSSDSTNHRHSSSRPASSEFKKAHSDANLARGARYSVRSRSTGNLDLRTRHTTVYRSRREQPVKPLSVKPTTKSLQEAALETVAIAAQLENKLLKKKPKTEEEKRIVFTRGIYRPQPVYWRGWGGTGQGLNSNDESRFSNHLLTQDPSSLNESYSGIEDSGQNKTTDSVDHSKENGNAELNGSALQQQVSFSKDGDDLENRGSAFSAYNNRKVTIHDERQRQLYGRRHHHRRHRNQRPAQPESYKAPRISEPIAVDFSKYGLLAQLWMEQVDMKTVLKSKTMYLSVMPSGTQPPEEITRSVRYVPTGDDLKIAPQWIIARGRSIRQQKRQMDEYHQRMSESWYLSGGESDLDLSRSARPMSPGKQALLFFKVGGRWIELAWVLFEGILDDSATIRMITDIQLKNPGQLTEQIHDVMNRWWKQKGNAATIEELKRALDLINIPCVVDETFNPRLAAPFFSTGDDETLECEEVEPMDPDVSRMIHEYNHRSHNASFNADQSPQTAQLFSSDDLLRQMQLKGLPAHSTPNQRQSLSKPTGTDSRDNSLVQNDSREEGLARLYSRSGSFRMFSSQDSLNVENSGGEDNKRKSGQFLTVQPLLKKSKDKKFRHESNI